MAGNERTLLTGRGVWAARFTALQARDTSDLSNDAMRDGGPHKAPAFTASDTLPIKTRALVTWNGHRPWMAVLLSSTVNPEYQQSAGQANGGFASSSRAPQPLMACCPCAAADDSRHRRRESPGPRSG
jgi:hypothetical protein